MRPWLEMVAEFGLWCKRIEENSSNSQYGRAEPSAFVSASASRLINCGLRKTESLQDCRAIDLSPSGAFANSPAVHSRAV